jgi:putative spermidine/putrescine transport system ATP-binding protein
MGVVFQSYALFPHLTAAANVAFGLEMQGVPRAERRRRVQEALDLVGLGDRAAAKPRQLSGGQQQRVALARALAIQPDVLLLDEPLSALDAKLREELRGEIRAIQRRVGATALFVTHDQAEALAMADLVAVMEQGRVVQMDVPEQVFERPAAPFVAEFVGRSARFEGAAESGGVRVGPVLLRAEAVPAGRVRVFVRPHRIRVLGAAEAADTVLDGTVEGFDYTGDVVEVSVRTAAGLVPVEVGTADASWRALRPGTAVRIGWRAADTLCFPA